MATGLLTLSTGNTTPNGETKEKRIGVPKKVGVYTTNSNQRIAHKGRMAVRIFRADEKVENLGNGTRRTSLVFEGPKRPPHEQQSTIRRSLSVSTLSDSAVASSEMEGAAQHSKNTGIIEHGCEPPFVGKTVRVHGTNEREINDCVGMAQSFNAKTSRYRVQLANGRSFELKVGNLREENTIQTTTTKERYAKDSAPQETEIEARAPPLPISKESTSSGPKMSGVSSSWGQKKQPTPLQSDPTTAPVRTPPPPQPAPKVAGSVDMNSDTMPSRSIRQTKLALG